LAIVSEGFAPFIEAILAHHEIGGLPIFANGLSIRENPKTGLLTLLPKPKPVKLQACKVQAALCKCDVVEPLVARAQTSVYIGNGRSDFCVSQHVNGLILFAKDELARNLEAKGARFFGYLSIRDIMEVLSGLMVQAAGGNVHQTIEEGK
jgi:2-hydroxy-3-keto-5-methylthiopentenyl-1-phosphate phosphatase